ncbi:MAG: hypothetical protein K8U57_05705 [Planctomycetes bacterium]|nr:hypothetical protein [Planctomycetota bacterium]
MSQFLRFYRPKEDKEILINVGMIWKIEVSYLMKGDDAYYKTSLKEGLEDENSVRHYRVFAGSEELSVVADPDDPVVKVLEEIYNKAVKN